MVLIEAMSFSLPAVSYLCKTGPGEIITEGENGFLVEPGHVAEFAQKMEFLMRDEGLRRQMGEKAANSLGRFEPEKIQYIKVIAARNQTINGQWQLMVYEPAGAGRHPDKGE